MPLPPGQTFNKPADIPLDSRPDWPPAVLETLPGGQGTRHAARKAPDGTRWCLGCDFTLDPAGQDTFCPACSRLREQISRRGRQARATAQVPLDLIDQIVTATEEMERAVMQLLAAGKASYVTAEKIDAVTLSCKTLMVLVGDRLKPGADRVRARQDQVHR
jgi:hypothetical protein